MSLAVGARAEVLVGGVAHGGHCVARHDGQVLFVRHALPGESAVVEVTEVGSKGRYLRADAIEVTKAHQQRVLPQCPFAGPGSCGGCDWQHAEPGLSRQLKAAVLGEAMARFAGIQLPAELEVSDVGGNPGGLGWRTRANLAVSNAGAAGLFKHRSNDVVVVDHCPQLVDPLAAGAFQRRWRPKSTLRFVAPTVGACLLFPSGSSSATTITERAGGREWLVAPEGFWQVHPRAADTLVGAVTAMLGPERRVVDLYSGVGLLGVGAFNLLGKDLGDLRLVESDRRSVELARRNCPGVAVTRAGVADWVSKPANLATAESVILDPPRTGAGPEVIAALASAPQLARIVYVACDPVALARDTGSLLASGWKLSQVRAFDLFPNTHHFEVVAQFERGA